MSEKGRIAKELFLNGANCAQAVLGAFASECDLDPDQALRLASGFGGGFSRLREVCGTVSGMYLVMNILYGYSDLQNKQLKDAHYRRMRRLADRFKKETSSLICRELLSLGKGEDDEPTSTERTAQYYKKRPCADLAALAAEILEKELAAEKLLGSLCFAPVKREDAEKACALWDSLKGTAYCLWDETYPTMKDALSDTEEQVMYGYYTPEGKLASVGTVMYHAPHDKASPWQGKNPCDLLRIGVDSAFQGKGVAGRFLDELYRIAPEKGFDSMRILVGRDNTPAVKLYERSGAVVRGEDFSWNTHWICMEKMFVS